MMYFKDNYMAVSHAKDSTESRYIYIIKHNSGIHSKPLDLDTFFSGSKFPAKSQKV